MVSYLSTKLRINGRRSLPFKEYPLRETSGRLDPENKTTVTGGWIAERLQMGHRVNASKAISRFRNSEETEVTKLKSKMLQSTACPHRR